MKIYQVDSFTTERFKGNPAGVCIIEKFPDTSFMQAVALEMNLSETAFVEIENNKFNIRYFTPTQEVPLCGHATLASAHMLFELGIVKNDFIFKAQESNLPISMQDGWIKMNFPCYKLTELNLSKKLHDIVGANVIETFKSDNDWIVARVEDEQEVINAKPNFEAIEKENFGMIALTSKSTNPEFDFVVRVFCNPTCGITEDPVTGSANCILVPYWNLKTSKNKFNSKQLSKRTGVMQTLYYGERIEILGQAKTIFTIEMNS